MNKKNISSTGCANDSINFFICGLNLKDKNAISWKENH